MTNANVTDKNRKILAKIKKDNVQSNTQVQNLLKSFYIFKEIIKQLLNLTTCLIATPAMHDGRSRALHSNH